MDGDGAICVMINDKCVDCGVGLVVSLRSEVKTVCSFLETFSFDGNGKRTESCKYDITLLCGCGTLLDKRRKSGGGCIL